MLNYLWSHEISCTNDSMHIFLLINAARRAKINKLDDIVVDPTEMDVLRLDVTMNDTCTVQVGYCRNDLLYNFGGLPLLKNLLTLKLFEDGSAIHHFIDEVNFPLVFVHLNNPSNVWVIKLLKHLDFVEQFPALSKLQVLFTHNFNRPQNL